MSNIGKKPIQIKEEVKVEVDKDRVVVTGPKGSLSTVVHKDISVSINDNQINVKKNNNDMELNKFYGLARSLIYNMVQGVTTGFEKKLELVGVGFRARIEDNVLVLNVGYTLPVRIKAPEGIMIKVEENVITVAGISKELVGNIADNIKKVRPPDPYKGKGIKYLGEKIRKKVGKAAKAVGGK